MAQAKPTLTAKAKLGLVILLVVAFVAGAVTARILSASPDASKESNDQSRTEDAALVVDSLEQYMQFHAPPGTQIEASRVQALKFRDNLATGSVNNGDSGNRFFAHKDNAVGWVVVFQGQDKPPQDVIDKYRIPEEWLGTKF